MPELIYQESVAVFPKPSIMRYIMPHCFKSYVRKRLVPKPCADVQKGIAGDDTKCRISNISKNIPFVYIRCFLILWINKQGWNT